MDMRWRLSVLCAAVLLAGNACAQGRVVGSGGLGSQIPANAYGTGTVTGHVTCGDTQRPGRFATVSLVPKPAAKAAAAPAVAGASTDAKAAKTDRRSGQLDEKEDVALQMVQGKTGLDGSFAIGELPAGDYYAVATMPGYTLPLGDAGEGSAGFQAVDVSKVLANFPLVHVEPDHSVSVELTMQRGGLIAGRVVFEDGSPAANVMVTTLPADGKDPMRQYLGNGLQQLVGMAQMGMGHLMTDDDGRYRVAGLQPGKYLVSITLGMGGGAMRLAGTSHSSSSLPDRQARQQQVTIYVPGVFRKSEAKALEVHAGELVNAEDLLVNLSGLHHLSGRVLALSDRHPIENVGLFLNADKEFGLWANAGADGTFHLDYVPDGNYTMRVSGYDMKPGTKPEEQKIGHFYSLSAVPVVLAGQDLAMDDLLLPEKKMDGGEDSDPE